MKRVAAVSLVALAAISTSSCRSSGEAASGALEPTAAGSVPAQSQAADDAAASPTPTPSTASPTPTTSEVSCLSAAASIPKMDKTWDEFMGDGDGVFVTIAMKLTNQCGKDIKAYAGTVEVFDAFGDSVFKGNWKETKKIPDAGTATSKAGQGYGFSQFEDPVVALKDANVADLTVTFTPEKLVFADGSRLT